VDFEPGIVQESSKCGVREPPSAGPVVLPPHGVVQEPIVGNGRFLGESMNLYL
jgi:hypothetical protein